MRKIGFALASLVMAAVLAADSHSAQWASHKVVIAKPVPVPVTPTPTPTRPPPPDTDCVKLKCVALTFDDGPGPDTHRLLDMLARHSAHATFFVVGPNARDFPHLLRRQIADGHEVGDHTTHHLDLTRRSLSAHDVRHEMDGTREIIKDILGFYPEVFRPPYGATDRRVTREAEREGLAQIIWSVDTVDWQAMNAAVVARRALRGLHRGSIILMHDIHPTTVDAVPRILDAIKTRGFTSVTVSDLLGAPLTPGKKYFGD